MEVDSPNKGRSLTAEQGGATIISLLTVLTCFLLASTYLNLAQAELRMCTRDIQARQALFLAEAGIDLARAELSHDPTWQPESNYVLPTGSFRVGVTAVGTGYDVVAGGVSAEATRTLAVNIVPKAGGGWQVISYQEVYNP
ncbi:MAG: hypothetical protein M0Z55_02390 [Peptococcaceae bacterium]|nr:hypothetical protein [Peptococcaceae bacterium]